MTIDLERYFARVGYGGSREPSLATLEALVERHTDAIPFENLDPLSGRPVLLDDETLSHKLLDEGRGGYCYELNRLFEGVLAGLGYRVTALAARVLWMLPPETPPMPKTHMLLRVELPSGPRLVDVGFGRTLTGTLAFVVNEPQDTPHERHRLVRLDGDFVLEVEIGEEWLPMYRFDLQRQQLSDFEMSSWYLCNHPHSRFKNHLVAGRAGGGVRYALRDRTFTIHRASGRREQRILQNADALRDLLVDTFGVRVPEDPGVMDALERIASGDA